MDGIFIPDMAAVKAKSYPKSSSYPSVPIAPAS